MRVGHLIGPELRDILRDNPEEVGALLDEIHPEDVADVIAELPEAEAAKLLSGISAVDAATIFERLEQMSADSVAQIAAEMAPDDRVEMLEGLDEQTSEAILAKLESVYPEAADEVARIDKWPDDSAGRLMTTGYVSVPMGATVGDAIDAIRKGEEAETVNYVYVVTGSHRLIAVVSIRDLLLGDPASPLSEHYTENIISVAPMMDQEDAARRMAKYDLTALPVVDERGAFLGIITVDDIIDVLTDEQSEDVQRLGGIEPLDAAYFATSFWMFIRKRASWLLALFVGTTTACCRR